MFSSVPSRPGIWRFTSPRRGGSRVVELAILIDSSFVPLLHMYLQVFIIGTTALNYDFSLHGLSWTGDHFWKCWAVSELRLHATFFQLSYF
jgi:hypothetical protein